jgi:hypothetical protein
MLDGPQKPQNLSRSNFFTSLERETMSSVLKRGIAGVFVTAAVAGGLAVAAAPANATAGQLCSARSGDAPFFAYPGGPWEYTVAAGGGIRDDGGVQIYGGTTYHFGHGNGHSSAWFRLSDSTCS